MELAALAKALPQIRSLGADLLAVSPELPDYTLTIAEKHDIPIDVLSDVTSEVLKKYRLWFAVPAEIKELYRDKFGINLEKYNGEGRWELPVPATYVLDGQGVVRAGVADADHTVRMDIEDILAALAEIRKGP
ncbi:MAG: redoxin domain-containing protein [Deltaproteobacteria bacterium]|nr:redoxin domain-containing protein [Deltaproteobacteria bacterium]